MDVREVNLTLDFCLRVGELLLSHGAGAADVTTTMRSLSRHLGLWNAEIDVTFVTVSMSHQDEPDDVPITSSRSVKQRTLDYEHLTDVDHLVRDVLSEKLDLREARSELGRITSTGHSRPRWAITLAMGLMAGAFAIMLGGGPRVGAVAFIAGAAIDRLQLSMMRARIPVFYQQLLAGALATLIAMTAAALPFDVDVSTAITANIIVLLAGISFMGALQDALTGFYITGAARIMEAIISTSGIIAGVSGGIAIAGLVGVSLPPFTPETVDVRAAVMTLVGGAIGAAAFAYSIHAPLRTLWPVGLLAGAGILIATLSQDQLGRAWSVGAAALLIGLLSFSMSGRIKVPPLVIIVPAVVSLLPGLSIYRGLSLMSDGTDEGTSQAMVAMFTAASIAVALAAGVILGEYVAQPLKREARRLEMRLSGPRLVGPVDPETLRREKAEEKRERRRREAEAKQEKKQARLEAEAKRREAAEERRRQRLARRLPWE